MSGNGASTLEGRTLYIHPMTGSGARLLAAMFRSLGVDARVVPPSDQRTLDLGSRYSAGDECLPEKITIGDYLKIVETEGFDPRKTAFLMPTAGGPCRFGQYWPLLESILKKRGLDDVLVVNPTSSDGYGQIPGITMDFFRSVWMIFLCSDMMRRMLLKTRPYERNPGDSDALYEQSIVRFERLFEQPGLSLKKLRERALAELVSFRDAFRAVNADYVKGRPLLVVVGEIFCRHNRYANDDIVRTLERHGAEAWLADISEWIFYTDWSRMDRMRRKGHAISTDMAVAKIKYHFMREEEHRFLKPFEDDFIGYEEPADTSVVAAYAEKYLPVYGARGEMALSLGRSAYCYHKGVDGIVDISPFSCMNGIVSEAVYPSFSRDHDGIPCRVFYFDGVNTDLDRDVEIYMELVRGYMSRKKVARVYPACFT